LIVLAPLLRHMTRPMGSPVFYVLFVLAALAGLSFHAFYEPALNQLNYGQPSARPSQVFGTGGPRAWQFAARLEF